LKPLYTIDDPDEATQELPRVALELRRQLPTLKVIAGRDMLKFVVLHPNNSIIIGRDDAADLVLLDASVSRKHARVHCDEFGMIHIQDLGSTNKTWVRDEAIQQAVLNSGDALKVGQVPLRLELLSPEELQHLQRVSRQVETANRDPLTGLLNRLALENELPLMLKASANKNMPICSIFADIDRFKSINDRYGHSIGDDVLAGVARLMMLGIRENDLCLRYGGEEILLFLFASEQVAADVAERIRIAIQHHPWERIAAGLSVTVSFGIAERVADEPIKLWLERSDKALYTAKNSGRNRVVRASKGILNTITMLF